ncbi:MAG TPA: uroporphyrinogen-III C-methyltransferase, partial [Gaiellales bacterium]|nr:uroporphyrinogen-III C-methyltransferase [Gaiellales bacterium]
MGGGVTVYLVGAGPGDPGLITVRGRELLAACDAVVYDRLANPLLVALAPAGAERVDAGKRAGRHTLTQQRINQLLVELGRRYPTVVRLKGGDPFVFGRGGEEALALKHAGIAFEVVPGVSSAHAVPAYAGIPVTHRGSAAQVTFVTGHEDPAKPGSDLDWAGLARSPGTLVFLMGVASLRANAANLIEHGMAADTPAAVISRGTLPDQTTVTAPLSGIADAAAGLPPPAIAVVGAVAALHHRLEWFERRPLHGRRVVVTRARAQASGLAQRLRELGAAVVEAPAIRIESLPFQPPALSSYDVICLTSANGVDRLLEGDVRALAGVRVAAIGSATVAALAGRGVVADVVPGRSTSEHLLEALGDVAGSRVLVATAEGARDVLPAGLAARGAEVDVLHLYRSVAAPVDREAVAGADLVTFTSSSTVDSLLAGLGPDTGGLRAVSIGPVT